MSIRYDIEYQKGQAMKSNKEYIEFLRDTLDKPLKEYFQESWDNKIPLEYHTEAAGKPVYHPLTMSRVLIYFNPKRLEKNTLKEESFNWFGMTLDSLKDYVKNGWIIVQLNSYDKYSEKSKKEIEDFFKDLDAKPMYVNIIDDLLPSYLCYDNMTLEDVLIKKEKEYRIKELYKKWQNIIKKPVKKHGVVIAANKVKENYLKLEIIRDTFERKGDQEAVDNINIELNYLKEIKNSDELAQRAYTSFLMYGTPILYSDGSGFVSVGSEPYWYIAQGSTKSIFKKIIREGRNIINKFTFNNQKILYFDNINHPHKIIKNHYKSIKNKNEKRAKELEKDIREMVKMVFPEANSYGYKKAFERFERYAEKDIKKIQIPLSIAVELGLWIGGDWQPLGAILGLTSELVFEARPGRMLALRCVARNKIFGINIKEDEIPNTKTKTPEAYKDIRFRIFRIPVTDKDHSSEKITAANLP